MLAGFLASSLIPVTVPAETGNSRICDDNSRFVKRRLDSDQRDDICQTYRGKVMLVVNTASRCAFTEQYGGLERLYADYRERGLEVVGFPSNDFGNQEPGSEKTINSFCRLTYGVRFPMYEKSRVKGDEADPLYKQLARGERPSIGALLLTPGNMNKLANRLSEMRGAAMKDSV